MKQIRSEQEVDAMLHAPLAIVFKHSTQCPISANAHKEIQAFLSVHKGAPVYMVDVIEQRPLSMSIAKCTGIQHESPQVIVLQHGDPVWHASHYDVTASALEEATVDFE